MCPRLGLDASSPKPQFFYESKTVQRKSIFKWWFKFPDWLTNLVAQPGIGQGKDTTQAIFLDDCPRDHTSGGKKKNQRWSHRQSSTCLLPNALITLGSSRETLATK